MRNQQESEINNEKGGKPKKTVSWMLINKEIGGSDQPYQVLWIGH